MIFYINDLIDIVEAYNENRELMYQLTIFDVLEEIEDITSDECIQRTINEIKMRV